MVYFVLGALGGKLTFATNRIDQADDNNVVVGRRLIGSLGPVTSLAGDGSLVDTINTGLLVSISLGVTIKGALIDVLKGSVSRKKRVKTKNRGKYFRIFKKKTSVKQKTKKKKRATGKNKERRDLPKKSNTYLRNPRKKLDQSSQCRDQWRFDHRLERSSQEHRRWF